MLKWLFQRVDTLLDLNVTSRWLFSQVNSALQDKDYSMALAAIDELLQETSNRELPFESRETEGRIHRLRGFTLIELNRFDEAIESLIISLKTAPADAQLYFSLALVYEKNSEYDDALNYIRQCLQLDSTDLNAKLLEIIIQDKRGENRDVCNLAEKLLVVYDQRSDLLAEQPETIPFSHLRLDPNELYVETLRFLIRSYYELGQLENATKYTHLALKWRPTDSEFLYLAASLDLRDGEIERALSRFLLLLQHDPDNQGAIIEVARIHHHLLPDFVQAENYYQKACKNSEDSSCHEEFLDFLLQIKSWKKAHLLLQNLLVNQPDKVIFLIAEAECAFNLGWYSDAENFLSRVFTILGDQPSEFDKDSINTSLYIRGMLLKCELLLVHNHTSLVNPILEPLLNYQEQFPEIAKLNDKAIRYGESFTWLLVVPIEQGETLFARCRGTLVENVVLQHRDDLLQPLESFRALLSNRLPVLVLDKTKEGQKIVELARRSGILFSNLWNLYELQLFLKPSTTPEDAELLDLPRQQFISGEIREETLAKTLASQFIELCHSAITKPEIVEKLEREGLKKWSLFSLFVLLDSIPRREATRFLGAASHSLPRRDGKKKLVTTRRVQLQYGRTWQLIDSAVASDNSFPGVVVSDDLEKTVQQVLIRLMECQKTRNCFLHFPDDELKQQWVRLLSKTFDDEQLVDYDLLTQLPCRLRVEKLQGIVGDRKSQLFLRFLLRLPPGRELQRMMDHIMDFGRRSLQIQREKLRLLLNRVAWQQSECCMEKCQKNSACPVYHFRKGQTSNLIFLTDKSQQEIKILQPINENIQNEETDKFSENWHLFLTMFHLHENCYGQKRVLFCEDEIKSHTLFEKFAHGEGVKIGEFLRELTLPFLELLPPEKFSRTGREHGTFLFRGEKLLLSTHLVKKHYPELLKDFCQKLHQLLSFIEENQLTQHLWWKNKFDSLLELENSLKSDVSLLFVIEPRNCQVLHFEEVPTSPFMDAHSILITGSLEWKFLEKWIPWGQRRSPFAKLQVTDLTITGSRRPFRLVLEAPLLQGKTLIDELPLVFSLLPERSVLALRSELCLVFCRRMEEERMRGRDYLPIATKLESWVADLAPSVKNPQFRQCSALRLQEFYPLVSQFVKDKQTRYRLFGLLEHASQGILQGVHQLYDGSQDAMDLMGYLITAVAAWSQADTPFHSVFRNPAHQQKLIQLLTDFAVLPQFIQGVNSVGISDGNQLSRQGGIHFQAELNSSPMDTDFSFEFWQNLKMDDFSECQFRLFSGADKKNTREETKIEIKNVELELADKFLMDWQGCVTDLSREDLAQSTIVPRVERLSNVIGAMVESKRWMPVEMDVSEFYFQVVSREQKNGLSSSEELLRDEIFRGNVGESFSIDQLRHVAGIASLHDLSIAFYQLRQKGILRFDTLLRFQLNEAFSVLYHNINQEMETRQLILDTLFEDQEFSLGHYYPLDVKDLPNQEYEWFRQLMELSRIGLLEFSDDPHGFLVKRLCSRHDMKRELQRRQNFSKGIVEVIKDKSGPGQQNFTYTVEEFHHKLTPIIGRSAGLFEIRYQLLKWKRQGLLITEFPEFLQLKRWKIRRNNYRGI